MTKIPVKAQQPDETHDCARGKERFMSESENRAPRGARVLNKSTHMLCLVADCLSCSLKMQSMEEMASNIKRHGLPPCLLPRSGLLRELHSHHCLTLGNSVLLGTFSCAVPHWVSWNILACGTLGYFLPPLSLS